MPEPVSPSSYDEVPYPSVPFVQSHPDRLATLARVFGLTPPPAPVATCRVLELGCAGGENLLPLGLAHPEAEFWGIDLSQRQVASAAEAIARLGLRNVRVQQMDLMDFPADSGTFDYIIAHGVYSWVPAPVRDKLLEIYRRHLRPHGVGYVSYNVYPGWRLRSVVRDVLTYHVRHLPDPPQRIRQAHAFLQFLVQAIPEAIASYGNVFRHALSSLEDEGAMAARLYHDFLEPDNEPVYFHQFVAQAARHGLQFLAEADIEEMQVVRFPPPVVAVLDKLGDDVLEREQYLDFLKNRPFRQTLLCHQEAQLDRQIRPERLAGLEVAADIKCAPDNADFRTTQPFKFCSRDGVEGVTDHPITKAALLHLSEIWPASLLFDELPAVARQRLVPDRLVVQPAAEYARDSQQLAENLLHLYTAGTLELHACPTALVTQVSERPRASPWARFQIARDRPVTNLRHHGVKLSDVHRHLVWLMDGTRTHQQLLEDLAQRVETEGAVVIKDGRPVQGAAAIRRVLGETLPESLRMAAKLALLVA